MRMVQLLPLVQPLDSGSSLGATCDRSYDGSYHLILPANASFRDLGFKKKIGYGLVCLL